MADPYASFSDPVSNADPYEGIATVVPQEQPQQQAEPAPDYGQITATHGKTLFEKLGGLFSRVDPITGRKVTTWDDLNRPAAELPRAPDLSHIPSIGMGISPKYAAAGYNAVVKPAIDSMTSPLGVATLPGLGAMPKIAQVGIGAGFTGLMAKGTYDQAKAAPAVLNDPQSTSQEKLEAVMAPVGSAAFTALGVAGTKHALSQPGAKVTIKGEDGQTVKVEMPEVSTDIPASPTTKAKLVALGHDPATLTQVTELAAQDVLAVNEKARKTAEADAQKQQKAEQAEFEKSQPPQETPPAVTQMLAGIKKEAEGQAVTELLNGSTITDSLATANAAANEIATKPFMPEVGPPAPTMPQVGLKAKLEPVPVKSEMTYDQVVKGKKTHYQKTLEEIGVTEAQMDAARNKTEVIPMPLGEGVKLKVGPSSIEGQGVFVSQEIPKGEILAPASIDGKWTPAGRYANHSGRPNATFVVGKDGRIDLVAKRALNPNEEITVNYKQAHEVVTSAKKAANDPVTLIEKVIKQSPDEFFAWSRTLPEGTTGESYRLGIEAINNPKLLKALKDGFEESKKSTKKIAEAAKAATEEDFPKISQDWANAAVKDQFFTEAIAAAENKGTAVGDPKVDAAHAAAKPEAPKPEVPAPAVQAPADPAKPFKGKTLRERAEIISRELYKKGAATPPEQPKVFTLPKALAGSKPRYSYGANQFELKFESELDKALYILAQAKKSKSDEAFLAAVIKQTGMTEREARSAGSQVKDQIKAMAKEGSDGDILTIPALNEDLAAGYDAVSTPVSERSPDLLPDTASDSPISRFMQERLDKQNTPPPEPPAPKPPVPPMPEAPKEEPIRNLAKRVIEDENRPKELRQRVYEDPSIVYDEFKLKELTDTARNATPEQLLEMKGSSDANVKAMATIELANRAAESGDYATSGDLYAEASTLFTNSAQLLNVAKAVRSPQAYVKAVEQLVVETAGKDKTGKPNRVMTPEQQKQILELGQKDILLNRELEKAELNAKQNWTEESSKAYKQAKYNVGQSKKQIAEFAQKLVPQGYFDIVGKAIQGNLLTAKSLAANVFGNFLWKPFRSTVLSGASKIDAALSAITGKPRKIDASLLPSLKELEAAKDGLKVAVGEFFTGPDASSYAKSEVQRGFTPIRSLVQAWTGKDLAVRPDGNVAVSDRVRAAVEGLIGAPPEVMFRLLNIGDKPFRRAAEMAALLEQAKLRGKTGKDLNQFLEFPDPQTMAIVEREARSAVFAQENKGINRLNAMLDKGASEILNLDKIPVARDALKLFSRMVVPFRQFPVNYIMTALNFASPELAAAKAMVYAKRGDQRRALISLTEGLIGVTMYAVADLLWDKGLVSEPTDKDAKRRSIQYDQMGPNKLNLSGLNRLRKGEDPSWQTGDLTADWSKLGIPAAILYLHTQKKSIEEKKSSRTGVPQEQHEETWGEFAESRLSAFPGMASFALDQSFLAGTSALLEAFQDPNPDSGKRDLWLSNMFRVISAVPVPNSIEALARAQYEFIPEMKGDTLGETIKNIWDFKTMQMPEGDAAILKRDMWGDKVRRSPESTNPYAYQFLDVTSSGRTQRDLFKQKLFELFDETESPDVYPTMPGRSISLLGITSKLTPADAEVLQEKIGKARRELSEPFVLSESFEDIPSWGKVEQLRKVYEAAKTNATNEFIATPGVLDKYFPELGQGQDTSRVQSRNPRASLRVDQR